MTNGYALSICYQTRLPSGSRVLVHFPGKDLQKGIIFINLHSIMN